MKQLVLAGWLLGCSGSTAPAPTAPAPAARLDPELSPALAPLAFMLGTWALGDAGREFWIPAGGALYGIGVPAPGAFEVMIIDDGDGPAAPDGVLRFIAMPGGTSRTEFRVTQTERDRVTFANPTHDAPKTITYELGDDGLVATLDRDTPTSTRFAFLAMGSAYPPAVEAAERTLAADALARGAEGIMAHVAPGGFVLDSAGAVVSGEALRARWEAVTRTHEVRREPIRSGAVGDLAFTVGNVTFVARASGVAREETYCTIWEKQDDGTWKVRFETGRLVNAPIAR